MNVFEIIEKLKENYSNSDKIMCDPNPVKWLKAEMITLWSVDTCYSLILKDNIFEIKDRDITVVKENNLSDTDVSKIKIALEGFRLIHQNKCINRFNEFLNSSDVKSEDENID